MKAPLTVKVKVEINNRERIGIVKLIDLIKCVKSLKNKDSKDWLYVPVFSKRFVDFENNIAYFSIDEIQIVKDD